jgi:hypothetical protein
MGRQVDPEKASNASEREKERLKGKDHGETRSRVEREVRATLGCFDEDPAPRVAPGFAARVLARIENSEPLPRHQAWTVFRRKVLFPALLILMIILNIVTVIDLHRTKKQAELARQRDIAALADSYALERANDSSYLR